MIYKELLVTAAIRIPGRVIAEKARAIIVAPHSRFEGVDAKILRTCRKVYEGNWLAVLIPEIVSKLTSIHVLSLFGM